MKVGSDEWKELLISSANEMQINVDHQHADQFSRHAQHLLQWNQKINLTSITDPVDIAIKHFVDSLVPLDRIPYQGSLLDIGTGGGFPGLPLKILRPQQSMVLIDGARKKINFVRQVIRELNLTEIQALQTRAEDLSRGQKASLHFDAIVARALADLDTILRLAAPLLKPGGRLVVYKGPQTSMPTMKDSVFQKANSFFQLSHYSYRLPYIGDRRTLIIIDHLLKG